MILFIYSKDGKVIAEDELCWAQPLHDDMIAKGYKHTATIDAKVFVEFLCNESKDLAREVKFLIEGTNHA